MRKFQSSKLLARPQGQRWRFESQPGLPRGFLAREAGVSIKPSMKPGRVKR